MSLDFAVLDRSGTPSVSAGIGVSDHHMLVEKAAALGLNSVLKVQDYYSDYT